MNTAAHDIDWHDSAFSRSFIWLKAASTLYVIGIPISHFALPHTYIWGIAVFFLIAMLFTYPFAAFHSGTHLSLELRISIGLAITGVLGILFTPWLIILAIFGHGIWDLMKHKGHGTPFFGWYVNGCVVVDWCYAAALTIFYITGPN